MNLFKFKLGCPLSTSCVLRESPDAWFESEMLQKFCWANLTRLLSCSMSPTHIYSSLFTKGCVFHPVYVSLSLGFGPYQPLKCLNTFRFQQRSPRPMVALFSWGGNVCGNSGKGAYTVICELDEGATCVSPLSLERHTLMSYEHSPSLSLSLSLP